MRATLCLAIVVALGCNEGGNRASPTPSGSKDTGEGGDAVAGEDTGTPPTEDTTEPPPPGAAKLSFEKQTGADGLACGATCLFIAAPGEAVELRVVYRSSDGAPIAGAQVSFGSTATAEVAKLSSKSASTADDGTAGVGLTLGAGALGMVHAMASVPADPGAGTLTFDIQVAEVATAPLTVGANYTGKASLAAFEVRLFLQEGGAPLCSDVHPDAPGGGPSPVLKKPLALGGKTTFETLPGLDEVGAQSWLVQVVGPSSGTLLVSGCTAGVEIKKGTTREVLVDVLDLPLRFQGTYLLSTRMDLHTGLSGPAGVAVDTLIGLFTEPGKTALTLACTDAGGILGTVCGYLMDDNGNPNAKGIIVTNAADAAFLDLIKKALGEQEFDVGQTVAQTLEDLRLSSKLTLGGEPAVPDGDLTRFEPGAVSEVWETMSFPWKIGAGCAPQNEDCGLITVKLSDIYETTLSATFGAGVNAKEQLALDVHPVYGFAYGTLVNFIVEKKVLPLLFGDGSTGLPVIDSYDKLAATLFGDELCLLYDDCCEFFTSKVGPSLPLVPDFLIAQACELAIPAAASTLRDLVVNASGELQIGTAQKCQAADFSGDRFVDTLGSKSTQCAWDASFDDFHPKATFYGQK